MRTCPNCKSRISEHGDFCEHCGKYLRWALTGEETAVAGPTAAKDTMLPLPEAPGPMRLQRIRPGELRISEGPRPVPPEGEVRLVLRCPAAGENGGAPAPRVIPGETVELIAQIYNRTDKVDHFSVSVSGLPDGWWSVEPGTVFLNPHGVRGRHDGEVVVRLSPPRSPSAEARTWPLTISVVSEDRRAEVATAQVDLEVAAYDDLSAELVPARDTGRRRGRFSVRLVNDGNAPVEVEFSARDEEDACTIELARPRLGVELGETRSTRLIVKPPGRHWIGKPLDYRFDVKYRVARAAEPGRLQGTFRRRPWLPWWLAVVVPVLVACAVVAYSMVPRMTHVPDLRGIKSPFAAQKLLTATGLELEPTAKPQIVEDVAPGTIVDQDPPPGGKLERGSVVRVVLAARSELRTVPSVVGMKPADADRRLRDLGLSLGSVEPQPADLDAPIVGQLPPPDVQVKAGTAINVTLELDTSPGAPDPAAVAGPRETPAPSPTPAPGAASLLAFDDGSTLLVWDGTAVRSLLGAGERGLEPAWAPDGTTLAFMRPRKGGRGQLVQMQPAAGPGTARVISKGPGDLHRPSFSPAGGILASIDERGGNGRLCLQPADGAAHVPKCLKAPGWSFERAPAWSPDGKVIVAIARRGRSTGLFGFRARGGPASADPVAWEPVADGLLAKLPRANAVAWSKDGRTVAAIGDERGGGGHLWLLDARADGTLGPPRPLPTLGCEVAWRGDGRLALSQYACGRAKAAAGSIVLLDPAAPGTPSVLPGVIGANPAWQPAAGGG